MSSRRIDNALHLSPLELRILNALLIGQMTGYEVASQCLKDGETEAISHGTLYPALKRLAAILLIEEAASLSLLVGPGKPRKAYRITSFGRETLGWQLQAWQRLIDQARDRTHRR